MASLHCPSTLLAFVFFEFNAYSKSKATIGIFLKKNIDCLLIVLVFARQQSLYILFYICGTINSSLLAIAFDYNFTSD